MNLFKPRRIETRLENLLPEEKKLISLKKLFPEETHVKVYIPVKKKFISGIIKGEIYLGFFNSNNTTCYVLISFKWQDRIKGKSIFVCKWNDEKQYWEKE